MFDYDHSGDIYTKDLEVCLMVFGKVYDADEIAEIKRDVDDHGIVHFPEFLRMISPVVCGDRTEEAREVFNLMDSDGGGQISPVELRHMMANLGEIIPDEEVDLMIKAADKDGKESSVASIVTDRTECAAVSGDGLIDMDE